MAGRRAMSKTLQTDGETIWSYMVPVARKRGLNTVEISPEMDQYWSRTTSYHLNLVRATARSEGWELMSPSETGGPAA
jgi:hypothetical protein